jgi:Na+-transporting NADH:ubiquinone oxidoreductase subunit NqrC
MNTEKQMVDRYGQAVVDLAVETFLFSEKHAVVEDYDGLSDAEQISKEQDAAIAEVEVNKNTELKSLYKPDVSLKLDTPAERLVQSKDRMKNIEEYDAVKKDFQSLQDVISCIYG